MTDRVLLHQFRQGFTNLPFSYSDVVKDVEYKWIAHQMSKIGADLSSVKYIAELFPNCVFIDRVIWGCDQYTMTVLLFEDEPNTVLMRLASDYRFKIRKIENTNAWKLIEELYGVDNDLKPQIY